MFLTPTIFARLNSPVRITIVAPYFVLLAVWIIGALQFSRKSSKVYEGAFYTIALLFTTLMIGLRFRVGGDWSTYEEMYDYISFISLEDAARFTDPAYAFLNWISTKVDGGIYIPNMACAAVFMLGLSALVRKQPRPWLAMTVAIPYLVIVVGMGYTRQAAAIGIVCWAIATADDDRIWKIVAKIALAAMFHKTAILFLPILLAPIAKRNLLVGALGAILFVLLMALVLGGSSDRLIANYVNSNYQSSGAAIRISMNVLAAVAFVYFRKKFLISPEERIIWAIMSGLSLASVLGLVISSSSVGVDRLSLFLIPLQVFVYSNLPSLSNSTDKSKTVFTFSVIFYSFAVQYVYFVYGDFSYTWLPYRNIVLATDGLTGE